MDAKEALETVRSWIVDEAKKMEAKKGRFERFNLTSLVFCTSLAMAERNGNAEAGAAALEAMRVVTLKESRPTHDVMTPTEAIGVIDLALAAS